MPKADSFKKQPRSVLIPDCNRLGLLVASFFATLVLAVNLFILRVQYLEVAFRVCLTFAMTWIGVAALVKFVLRTTVAEVVARRRAEKERKREAKAKAAQEAAEAEESGDSE